ncbi:hypothetical protein GF377_04025, partial [candidate division GN15 bacterium]|nr:hypothetical protein [candidate division GN15 bacterium]
ANPRTICNYVYYDLPRSTMLLTGRVLETMEFHAAGRVCVVTMTRQMLDQCGAKPSESDGLVDFTMYTRGVLTGALVKEVDDNTSKVSLRSADGINVANIAATFGGGGHYNAAGATLSLPLDKARAKIITLLSEAMDQEAKGTDETGA